MIDEALTKLSEKLNPQEKNIVVVHTGISGSTNTLPGLVSTSILDLFKDKAIYIAGGHIHSFTTYPKEKPYFLFQVLWSFLMFKMKNLIKRLYLI